MAGDDGEDDDNVSLPISVSDTIVVAGEGTDGVASPPDDVEMLVVVGDVDWVSEVDSLLL